jgi:regulator of sirC expression with transglutaminase-like and TPR domain
MDAVARFAELAALPAEELDLAEAALNIAAGANPSLEVGRWVQELERLADGVESFEDLRTLLFDELGFAGNKDDYYDPRNSYLNEVIERRAGIPITLSVLMIEVGRRAGVDVEGIAMPAHFLVRDKVGGAYCDPFESGTLMDRKGCEALFKEITGFGSEVEFGPDMLQVARPHDILARMLVNLKSIFSSRGDALDLEWVIRMRLALPGVPRAEAVELGEALARQGRVREAAREVERYAERHPEMESVFRAAARGLRARLN